MPIAEFNNNPRWCLPQIVFFICILESVKMYFGNVLPEQKKKKKMAGRQKTIEYSAIQLPHFANTFLPSLRLSQPVRSHFATMYLQLSSLMNRERECGKKKELQLAHVTKCCVHRVHFARSNSALKKALLTLGVLHAQNVSLDGA